MEAYKPARKQDCTLIVFWQFIWKLLRKPNLAGIMLDGNRKIFALHSVDCSLLLVFAESVTRAVGVCFNVQSRITVFALGKLFSPKTFPPPSHTNHLTFIECFSIDNFLIVVPRRPKPVVDANANVHIRWLIIQHLTNNHSLWYLIFNISIKQASRIGWEFINR